MSYLSDERFESKSRAKRLLEELKKKEKEINFHSKQIGKNTIIYCKNEERISEYEDSYKNIKNW